MDKKKKFEKLAEMMKSYCRGEEDMAGCCSMISKMMDCCEGEETEKKKKDTGQTA